MKILLAKAFARLTFVGVLAKALKELGHDVHILIPAQHPDCDALQEAGINIHINDIITPRFQRRSTLLKDMRSFKNLIAFFKKESFDIINPHLPTARLFCRLASRCIPKSKVVSVIHGNECHHETWTNHMDAGTICVSHAIKRFLITKGLPQNKWIEYKGFQTRLPGHLKWGKRYIPTN